MLELGDVLLILAFLYFTTKYIVAEIRRKKLFFAHFPELRRIFTIHITDYKMYGTKRGQKWLFFVVNDTLCHCELIY